MSNSHSAIPTAAALDTIHHYLKLAGRGQSWADQPNASRELADAFDKLKEFAVQAEQTERLARRVAYEASIRAGTADDLT